MGKSGKKVTNIFKNPGIANNSGVVAPKLPGVGAPGKYKTVAKSCGCGKKACKGDCGK